MNAIPPVVREDPLADRLMTVQNNYVLGLAAITLLTSDAGRVQLKTDSAQFGIWTVQFEQVADLMAVPAHRDDAIKSFLIMLMCSLVKDTFELTRHHARRRGMLPDLRVQHWYHFARLVRNCLGHNFLFHFNVRDHALLPVHWNNCEITRVMDGQPLRLQLFGYEQAWQLFLDMRQYAIDRGL